MIGLLALGFLIGMRHAFEADHLAAVATLVTRTHSVVGAVSHGLAWGLGHTLTLFFTGSLVLTLDVVFSETMAHGAEMAVGIMLVALGADVIRRLVRERLHRRALARGNGTARLPVQAHRDEIEPERHRLHLPARALLVGLMHGLVGSAVLILVVVGSASSTLAGLGYMVLFGLGSMTGMALVSLAIAIPMHRYARPFTWMHNGIHGTAGAFSVGLGLMVVLNSAGAWTFAS